MNDQTLLIGVTIALIWALLIVLIVRFMHVAGYHDDDR